MKTSDSHDRQKSPVPDRLRVGTEIPGDVDTVHHFAVQCPIDGVGVVRQVETIATTATQDFVDFHGRYHDVTHAGINPLPVQRPIPIWIGAGGRENPVPSDPVLKRIARLADGWFPQMSPEKDGSATMAKLAEYAQEAGRDPSTIEMEARINSGDGDPEFWQEQSEAWQKLGATHVSVNTMKAGYRTPEDHINAIQQFKEVVGA